MTYQSEPKDLSIYRSGHSKDVHTNKKHKNDDKNDENDDAESVGSNGTVDTDTSVDVYISTDSTDSTNISSHKEGFTGKKDKKDDKKEKKTSSVFLNFFAGPFAAPDVSGQTINQRIVTGFRVLGQRMLIVMLLIFLGINFRFAANKFANEDYFPTDGTLPPYYPTKEELKEIEPIRDLRQKCKDDDTAEYISRFRRPDQTYPEFLYYDGMVLKNKDPCVTEGMSSDGWYIRLSIQISRVFGVVGDIFNSMINIFTSLFTRAVKGAEDMAETAVVEPELNVIRQAEQLEADLVKTTKEAEAKAFAEKQQALAQTAQATSQVPTKAIPQASKTTAQQKVANLNRPTVQSGKGKSYIQTGGAPPVHRFSKFLNPYGFDRERKITDLTYFYRPIWAKSTQVSATYTNMLLQKLLGLFKGDTEIKESHGTFSQLLNIFLFIFMSLLVLIGGAFTIPFATMYAWIFSIISIVLAGGGVPAISVLLLGMSIIGIPLAIYIGIFLGFNVVVNSGIVMWRFLYFLVHMILGPLLSLKQGKEELKEFGDIIRKDLNGFFALTWILLVFTAYQVAPSGFSNGVLIGGILSPILFGFAMNASTQTIVDTLSTMNVLGVMN